MAPIRVFPRQNGGLREAYMGCISRAGQMQPDFMYRGCSGEVDVIAGYTSEG